jgi:hypothetical protein
LSNNSGYCIGWADDPFFSGGCEEEISVCVMIKLFGMRAQDFLIPDVPIKFSMRSVLALEHTFEDLFRYQGF